jgi:transcriptional regulator with PAS, ATPase and Fis domain
MSPTGPRPDSSSDLPSQAGSEGGQPLPPSPADRPRSPAGAAFRWQALFQHAAEPLFVLDRRRRLVFVNQVWEALTGLGSDRVHGLPCRRPRPLSSQDSLEEVLAHVLTPTGEVNQGTAARTRRLFPGRPGCPAPPAWWEVEFFPIRMGGAQGGAFLVGRIRVLPAEEMPTEPPLPERLAALRDRAVRRVGLEHLEGTSPSLRRLGEQVRLAAQVRCLAFLHGEPGAGKRTLARLIHRLGAERDRAFAVLDCARLPFVGVCRLLFSERAGNQRAELGTIYLREPSALPREVQARLSEWLRALPADAPGPRLLMGGRVAPLEAVRAGVLVEELAVDLSTLVIEVPPLRERRDDLPRLVESLLGRAGVGEDRQVTGLTAAAWEVIRSAPWPGNLAELYATLREARGHAAGERIDVGDLPAALRRMHELRQIPERPPERILNLPGVLEEVERRLIQQALRRARGNRTRAAELLGIWRPRLLRRLEALKIADTDEPEGGEGTSETPPCATPR